MMHIFVKKNFKKSNYHCQYHQKTINLMKVRVIARNTCPFFCPLDLGQVVFCSQLLHRLTVWRKIWSKGTCNSCKHWVIFSNFFKLFYYFEPAPNWGSTLAILRGFSPIFDLKCEFEATNWTYWRSTNITRTNNEFLWK